MCKRIVVMMILLMMAAPMVTAQPLADRIPDDAIIYIGWQGATQMGADYEASHLKAVLNASNLKPLLEDFLPQLLEQIAASDPTHGRAIGLMHQMGTLLFKNRSAFYMGAPPPGPIPIPAFALIVEAGDDAKQVAQQFRQMIGQPGSGGGPGPGDGVMQMIPSQVYDHKGVVVLAVGMVTPQHLKLMGITPADQGNQLMIAPGQNSLGKLMEHNSFKNTMKHVDSDAVIAMYLDVQRMVQLIDTGVQMLQMFMVPPAGRQPGAPSNLQLDLPAPWGRLFMAVQSDLQPIIPIPGGDPMQLWRNVRNALGIDSIKSVAFTGSCNDKDWQVRSVVHAPAPRRGLTKLMDTGPVDLTALRAIPAMASVAVVMCYDLAKIYDELYLAVGNIDPMWQTMLDSYVQQVETMLNVRLRQQLLSSLGDQWSYYSDRSVGGTGSTGFVVVNKLRNPQAARTALGTLERALVEKFNQLMVKNDIVFDVRTTQIDGIEIHYLTTPMISPAWAIVDGYWYIAMYPQVVAAAVDYQKSARPSMAENKQFAALHKRMGNAADGSIGFYDIEQAADTGYQAILALSQMGLGMADIKGFESPAMVLPPLYKLRPHLKPAMQRTWTDDAGWHVHGISPFPFAEIFMMHNNALSGAPFLTGNLQQTLEKLKDAAGGTGAGGGQRSPNSPPPAPR